jgi:hypothetical protein
MPAVILSAGFGGIAATEVARNRITDITILGQAPDFGGMCLQDISPVSAPAAGTRLATAGGATVLRAPAEAASDRMVQEWLMRTASTRCKSWCWVKSGRILANWSGYMREYVQGTLEFDPAQDRRVEAPARVGA